MPSGNGHNGNGKRLQAFSKRTDTKGAPPFPDTSQGVLTPEDVDAEIDHIHEHGLERGVSTGWPSVDQYYTVRPGELTVVSGIPGTGKSGWLDALLVNLAHLHGWIFGLFSPENQPMADHVGRMIEKHLRIPFSGKMTKPELAAGKRWVTEHFSWIMPEDASQWELETILKAAESLIHWRGIQGLVIDPWNEMESVRPSSMNESEYIGHCLKYLRQFARTHRIHVWLVVHPQKMYRLKDGSYPVPTLYDCSSSAHFRNKPDNGVILWRDTSDATNREVCVYVQKIRFRQVGRIGMAKLHYEVATATYRDLAGPTEPPEDDLPSDWQSRFGR